MTEFGILLGSKVNVALQYVFKILTFSSLIVNELTSELFC